MLEAEQNYLEDQVNGFEQWEECKDKHTYREEQVICPICQSADLISMADKHVKCSNAACSFRFEKVDKDQTLSYLREKLQKAYEEHLIFCSEVLCFDSLVVDGRSALVGRCMTCGRAYNIV